MQVTVAIPADTMPAAAATIGVPHHREVCLLARSLHAHHPIVRPNATTSTPPAMLVHASRTSMTPTGPHAGLGRARQTSASTSSSISTLYDRLMTPYSTVTK